MLNPIFLMHSLCASISSPQFSSPRSTIQASRTCFVSGQAQQAFSFFFSSFGFSSSDTTTAALTVSLDIGLESVFKMQRFNKENLHVFHVCKIFSNLFPGPLIIFSAKTRQQQETAVTHAQTSPGFFQFKMADVLVCVFLQPYNVTLNKQVY